MIPGKPVFSLRLDLERCSYDVYVNGGLLAQNLDQHPLHASFPINHWLRSGLNELEVQMVKWEGEPDECNVKAELQWKGASAPADATPVTLFTLVHDAKTAPPDDLTQGSSPSGNFDARTGRAVPLGDVRVGPASIQRLPGLASQVHVLSRTFEAKLPFPEWAFLRGERQVLDYEFENEEQQKPHYDALLATYQTLYGLLAKGDIDGFVDACEERSREIDIAYYNTPGETRAGLREQLKSAMSNPEYELATLDLPPGQAWGYTVGSKGTLVALTQGNRASTILRYVWKSEIPFSIVLPVFFRKENGKYIVTR